MTVRGRTSGTLRLGNTMTDCVLCGKRTHSSNDGYSGAEMCGACLERTLYENQCQDRVFESDGCTGSQGADCPVHGARFARLDAIIDRQRAAVQDKATAGPTKAQLHGIALWTAKLAAWDAKPRCVVCLGYNGSKTHDRCGLCREFNASLSQPHMQNERRANLATRREIERKIQGYGGTPVPSPYAE